MDNRKHYLAGIIAFVIWGFFSIPLRALKAYHPGEILFFRIMFTLIIMLVIIVGFRKKLLKEQWHLFRSFPRSQRGSITFLTLAGGALLAINWLAFIIAVNEVNIKTASFSYFICPVLTAVFGFWLLKEKMTSLQWTAVGLCVISCILLGISSVHELQYSILVAFTYAAFLISQRKNQGIDRLISLGIQIAFSFVLMCLFYPFLVTTVPTSGYFYEVILIIAVVFTVIPLFLNLFALNRINSATIGILMYLNPLLNFSVAFLMFHETANGLQLTGYSVIIVALVLFNYPYIKRIKAMGSHYEPHI